MPKVIYDGEVVEFHGELPKDLQGMLSLMHHTAQSQGRMLLSVKVDGREALSGEIDLSETIYNHVEVTSGSENQLYLKALDMTMSQVPAADEAIDPILEALLSDTWTNAFNKLNSFLQSLAPYFELMANLSQYAKKNSANWSRDLDNSLNSLEANFKKILSMCEKQEVADLTSLLNFDFRPVYASSIAMIKGTIRKSFVE